MSGPDRRRGWVSVAGRLVLAFGLLGLAISLNRGQLRSVLARPADWGLFGAAFGLYLGGLVLAFVRWWMLMRVLGLAVGCLATLRLGFIGLLFNLVIPGAIGGDVVKGALLFRLGVNRTQAVASIVVDRVLGLLGLFGLAAVVGLTAWGRLDPSARRLVVVAWVLLIAFATALAFAVRPKALSRPVANERRARRRADLKVAATAYRGRPAVLALSLVMALATHTLNVLAFRSASHALYPNVPTIAEHAVLVPLILFSTAVPLPLAALGLTEEVSAQLFRLVAFPGGAVAMMAFRLLQYGGAAIGAALYLPDRRQARAALKAAEEESAPRRSAVTEESVVFGVGPDPEPGQFVPVLDRKSWMVHTDPYGPETPDPLEMHRRVARIVAEQFVTAIRQELDFEGEGSIEPPEPWRGTMVHRSVQRPSRRS